MKITRETEYAFRCVSFLARKPSEVRSVEEIAAGTGVSPSFLAKILQKLQRGDLVQSFRGILGGFALARSPAAISMFDVLSAMGDPLIFNECVAAPDSCVNSGDCLFHSAWLRIRSLVEEQLRATPIISLSLSSEGTSSPSTRLKPTKQKKSPSRPTSQRNRPAR